MQSVVKEALRVYGRVRVITRRVADGTVLTDTGWLPNQITYYAANALAAWLTGTINRGPQGVHFPHYMELGTGSGTPSPSDTALFNGVSATSTPCSQLSVANDTPNSPIWTAVWGGANAGNIAGAYSEVGLFDADGHLWAHLAGLTIEVSTSTSTTVQWQWTITV
ncbi:MAG: hypothetical protein K6V97_03790 [Actinomycetia bacterium]|nr:hypothetical protein [Actinomycetes bacterium]